MGIKNKTIDEIVKDFFKTQLMALRQESEMLEKLSDDQLFIVLCLKYYYFSDPQWTYEDVLASIVDGSNDGSIDALLVDEGNEDCPLVAIQAKFRNDFDYTEACGELVEIKDTLKALSKRQYENYSKKVKDRFLDCSSNLNIGQSQTNYIYFSSFVPKTKKKKQYCEQINNAETKILFGDDIKADIEAFLEKTGRVKTGKLIIDREDNQLRYEESTVVNISANSLKDLYDEYRRSLFGLNLRYYVRNTTVDNGIKDTVQNHSDQFWYLNNGIVIACEDYRISGNVLNLNNFSIINGGQTTDRINNLNFKEDFYIMCKVVKVSNAEEDDDSKLSTRRISIATNSQKPIQKKDLASNKKEQIELKAKLKGLGIQYIIKGGETIEKQYSDSQKHISLDQLGKLGLTAVMQRPWTRANANELYDESKGFYYQIYKGTNVRIFADLLKLDVYYKSFVSSNYQTNNKVLANNARTFVLAIITLISYYIQNPKDEIFSICPTNEEQMTIYVKKLMQMDHIFKKFPDDSKSLYPVFGNICDYIIDLQFSIEKRVSEQSNNQNPLVESNFLKSKENYYKCLPELFKRLKNKDNEIYKKVEEFIS